MIRLPRLSPVALVATVYVFVFGAALGWLLRADPAEMALCLAPAVAIALLGVTSQSDRRQYVARIFAASMFLPALLMMWASSHDSGGLWLLGAAGVHVLALLAMVLWLASFSTRIYAVPGTPTVAPERLTRRFAALQAAGAPIIFSPGASASEWLIDVRPNSGDGRTHRVRLRVDAAKRAVQLLELVGSTAAKPITADERSMRTLGDPRIDPTRPDAQLIWARTWQSTMIVPERLAATATDFHGDTVRYRLPSDAPQDAEAWVTLLAAVVTRSGYEWQPRLFGLG